MNKQRAIAILLIASLCGCGETGHDENGPFKAYLNLKNINGEINNFYLGGYDSLVSCTQLISSEVKSYELEQNRKFYTNAEFNYGGFKTEKLSIEHTIVGIQCTEEI